MRINKLRLPDLADLSPIEYIKRLIVAMRDNHEKVEQTINRNDNATATKARLWVGV